MAKKKTFSSPIVYSTDENYRPQQDQDNSVITLPPENQNLKISIDKKLRAGKVVTLITGFAGRDTDLEDLTRRLKNFCGAGGSFKNGDIIVQGDNKEKIFQWLQKNGYRQARKI